MTASEKLMRKKKIYKEELDQVTPMSDALWKQSTARLEQIRNQYGEIPKGVRGHTDKIFPAAAVYLTVKEELGEKTAYSVLENASVRLCSEVTPKLAKLMRLPGMKSLFVRMWDPMTKKMFGPENGFRNVFYPKKKGEYRMDVISCPYFRYFTELRCPEITRIFCENDDRIYGCLPGLQFLRTGTLGKGAERCDFWMKKE
ncbi:MAG: L-2-amino-thiazoline-4-carboxylic acid hydrolase [Clostridia bacterium]|nr:L-2-amino-thiazoline-4-carboxylic acid hydrolase [Clostridia bacterium]